MGNDNLHNALKNKNDEFYTFYEDIEKELELYSQYFSGKTILCPADDENSNFWKFLNDNYTRFGIKELIATHKEEGMSFGLVRKNNEVSSFLCGNGDFFCKEVQDILKTVDIVITNPPFSLFREFLCSIECDFIVIGTENAISSKELFPLFSKEKVFFGKNKVKTFFQPNGETKDFGNICWITSFKNDFNPPFIPKKTYRDLKEKKKYDNYDALNIDKVSDIPYDYFEPMGVPITYLKKHNPQLFTILGIGSGISKKNKMYGSVKYYENDKDRGGAPLLEGKIKYTRVFIERKK